ncbi:MAG: glycosyltransferase [Planctomycetia bacterium]|nr:glycosyltransferase [Planctomycetia bacterium]
MSSTDGPLFTVVMATYGRGRHIEPSIRSVLRQELDDFELLVVGDHCTDETPDVVRAIDDARLRWINLAERVGSQSGPNNAGIAAARGRMIAYLGHDDVWEPFHLQSLSDILNRRPQVDFAVGGAIFHLPNGIPGSWVTGLFTDDADKLIHFFPPSSFAHRRSVCDRIGGWRLPMQITAPVDAEFVLRAARAGMGFASTGLISVHKFAAGHRYLSYLDQESNEQRHMLASLASNEHAETVRRIVDDARRVGSFMIVRHQDYDRFPPGELARQSLARKGLMRAEVRPLKRAAVLRQSASDCALDWEDTPQDGIRWARANPRPRLLLPFTRRGCADLRLVVAHADRAALHGLCLHCNGELVRARLDAPLQERDYWVSTFRGVVSLQPAKPSILHFHLSPNQVPRGPRTGIGVGDIRLTPLGPLRRLFRGWIG